MFAAYDLFRTAMIDSRVSSFFTEQEWNPTIQALIGYVNEHGEKSPYNLRIVALHLSCNFLSGPLSSHLEMLPEDLLRGLVKLASTSLLDAGHANVRVAAASLAFNLATANHQMRTKHGKEGLSSELQLELVAAVSEALGNESESAEAATGLLLALALIVHMAPLDSEILDLCRALDVSAIASSKKDFANKSEGTKEAAVLLDKGLKM
jgi:hypothetical protein